MAVEWPDRRADVLAGLETLAAEPPGLREDGSDPRIPGLTNAVHWVVDDTGWDNRAPAEFIGTVLVDEAEASAVARVVREIVTVSERQAPEGSDHAWFTDEAWPRVREAAAEAAALMRRNG
jgi:hypothetical protein